MFCFPIHSGNLVSCFEHFFCFAEMEKGDGAAGVICAPADTAGDLDEGAFGEYVVFCADDGYVDIWEGDASFKNGGG